jgi:hypothetical protein
MVSQNNKGYSLIELMIGAAVMVVVSMAMIDVTKLVSSSSKGQETHANAATLASMISQNLRFQSTCATTVRNGGAEVPYDRNQALDTDNSDGVTGMPIAISIPGMRAGPLGNVAQITGTNNAVSTGAVPTFAGATSDLSLYGLEVRRIAFVQLAESASQRFGYAYIDLEIPNTRTVFGGNAIRRKMLGGVVLEAAGATVTSCYGNSPETNLATVCTGMGCTWTSPNCDCPKAEFTCGPGELFWGVSAQTGLPVCKELGGGACPAGQYVSGIGLERVICSAVPDEPIVAPSTDCPPTTLSWTPGADTCTFNASSTTNGGSIVANDSTAPTTGTANFTCNSGTWSAPSGATCTAAPLDCPSAPVSWDVGGNICSGTTPLLTNTNSGTASDATAPTTGNANYTCTSGALVLNPGATCAAAPTGTYWKLTGVAVFFADGSTTCTFSNITTATCSPVGSGCKITTNTPLSSGGAMCNYCLSGGPWTWYYTCSNCEAPGTSVNICDPSSPTGSASTTACCSGSVACTNGSTMGFCN